MSEITHEQSLEKFYEQFEYVLENYTQHGKRIDEYANIVIGGLGGSGIGGRIARTYFWNEMPIPVEVYSDYNMPNYSGSRTLAILCSYSGNTEETLSMFAQAKEKGCDIICMASGGNLMALAQENSLKTYTIAEGFQPRMTLGFALGNLLMILGELLGKDLSSDIKQLHQEFKSHEVALKQAKHMHGFFKKSIGNKFVLITDMAYEAVGIRCCQQIQENAKGEAFISVLPESNHNMIESYHDIRDTNYILLNSGNNDRVTLRFEFLKKLLAEKGNIVYDYPVKDASLSSIFEVIHATDWFSIWASNDKKVNNMEVGIIMGLKDYLSSKG